MKKIIGYVVIALIVASCGRSDGQFHLEGRFKNLNQGDLYLYSLDDGRKDTLHVSDGRIVFNTPLEDTLMMMLLFPNFSEIPVVATPGSKVTIDCDVQHLKETRVEGTADNDILTRFRLAVASLSVSEATRKADSLITACPESPAAQYLLRKYFLLSANPDYKRALQLCDSILAAQPAGRQLSTLRDRIESLTHAGSEGTLPHFSATDTKGRTVSEKDLKGKVNVVCVWSMNNFDSQQALRLMRAAQRQHPDSIEVVSISIDATHHAGQAMLDRDSATWSNVCTGEMWRTPALRSLGIATLPANIVTDSRQHIVARNLRPTDLKKKVEELLN